MKTTRLDVVLRLREEAEKTSRTTLGKALGKVDVAQQHLEQAQQRAARCSAGERCGAWLLDVFDRAHESALAQVKVAEGALTAATADKDVAHAHHGAARIAQRVIARAVDGKRSEMRQADDRREQAALDELAILRA